MNLKCIMQMEKGNLKRWHTVESSLWHPEKRQGVGNGSLATWLGLGVGDKFNYKDVCSTSEFFGVMEQFCTLIELVVTWTYACVKIQNCIAPNQWIYCLWIIFENNPLHT